MPGEKDSRDPPLMSGLTKSGKRMTGQRRAPIGGAVDVKLESIAILDLLWSNLAQFVWNRPSVEATNRYWVSSGSCHTSCLTENIRA